VSNLSLDEHDSHPARSFSWLVVLLRVQRQLRRRWRRPPGALLDEIVQRVSSRPAGAETRCRHNV